MHKETANLSTCLVKESSGDLPPTVSCMVVFHATQRFLGKGRDAQGNGEFRVGPVQYLQLNLGGGSYVMVPLLHTHQRRKQLGVVASCDISQWEARSCATVSTSGFRNPQKGGGGDR
jgi:hypothetical protein